MGKTAIVTGMTGQDGPYMAKLLVEKGIKVYGVLKRYSAPNLENLDYLGTTNDIELVTGDITDENSINQLVKNIQPTYFVNLGAQGNVGDSWEIPKQTTEANAIGPLNCLQAIKTHSPSTRFYQASTSEMFGDACAIGDQQNEDTPFWPNTPYSIAKLYGHWTTSMFRKAHGIYAVAGILFNHESPLRGIKFVTRKITDGVARIKLGLSDKIILGNLDSGRDWGYAPDFMEAIWLMLNQETPKDYVIASGHFHTIKEFLDLAFKHVGITDWEKHVGTNPMFKRPVDVARMYGDSSRAQLELGWQPKTSFEDMIKIMVDADLKRLQSK